MTANTQKGLSVTQKTILYAGDGPPEGAARYLLAILKSMDLQVVHVTPGVPISDKHLKIPLDAVVFSDYSFRDLSPVIEKKLVQKITEGAGLLMVGGWGSFSGPFGGWKGSAIESLLPVTCLNRDDRTQYPGGAHLIPALKHRILEGLPWKNPPAVCGFNRVKPRKNSKVLIHARKLIVQNGKPAYSSAKEPLLVINASSEKRIAAMTTDFAPHWCAGFVDWGVKSIKLKAGRYIEVQVGDSYMRFVRQLFQWLLRIEN